MNEKKQKTSLTLEVITIIIFLLFLFPIFLVVENPAESCHLFRFKVASDSGRKLPPIPV